MNPEHFDWDPVHCKLYLGNLYSARVTIWDPYTNQTSHVEFPGITNTDPYHISGVNYDLYSKSGRVFFNANTGIPFETVGKNLTGPNKLIALSTVTNTVEWIADLNPAIAEASSILGFEAGGTQDIVQDVQGNSYIPTTYGQSIIKVSRDGKNVTCLWARKNNDGKPYEALEDLTGIEYHLATNTLISFSNIDRKLYAFSLSQNPVEAREIPISDLPADATGHLPYFPPKYNQNVLIVEDVAFPKVTVLSSEDHWKTAQWKGNITNPLSLPIPPGTPFNMNPFPTAVTEITGSVYLLEEYLDGPNGGNRTAYAMYDLTSDIEALL